MRIGIDARFWGPEDTGLGVYTKELVKNLARLDKKNHYILFVRKDIYNLLSLPQSFKKIIVDIEPYSFKEQLLLPFILYKERLDIVHFPSINVPFLYVGNYIVTIHDLIKHESKGIATTTRNPAFYWIKYLLYRLLFRWIIHVSKHIIVPSFTVQNNLVKYYPETKGKITTTYESTTMRIIGKKTLAGKEMKIPQKFAIYTGNAYPHKNIEMLITIWGTVFKKTNTQLVLVGARSVFIDRIKKIIVKHNAESYVSLLGFVKDDQLQIIYQKALCYVFPTILEGFGLPGLDAMACGLSVVCSDIPVLREIYGSAAYYFDPKNPSDMTTKILEVLTSETLREKLIIQGTEQIKKYSWEKMAEQTLNIYNSFS